MTTTKQTLLLTMLFSALLVTSLGASAQVWTAAASTCAVDESDLGQFQFDNGTFRFLKTLANEPDTIVARCNVTNPMDSGEPTWDRLTMGYIDQSGTGANARVRAKLVSVYRWTGAVAVIATVDSNSYTDTTATSHYVNFAYAFDFTNNYAYYVSLTLDRTTNQYDPQVWYVKLDGD